MAAVAKHAAARQHLWLACCQTSDDACYGTPLLSLPLLLPEDGVGFQYC